MAVIPCDISWGICFYLLKTYYTSRFPRNKLYYRQFITKFKNMVSAWYTLIVGIILSLNGIVFLIFSPDGFELPNWYLGLLVLIGVIGVILGIVAVGKKKEAKDVSPTPQSNE